MAHPSSDSSDHSIAGSGRHPRSISIEAVRSPRWAPRLAALILVLVAAIVLVLIYVPWQQSVTGYGRVMVFTPMDRPQTVEAQIPGRLVRWDVREGDQVVAGALIAELRDLDSKFLDLEQPRRLQAQRTALVQRRSAAEARVAALEAQYQSLTRSRGVAIPAANQRAKQTIDRLRGSDEALKAAQQAYKAAREVAVPAARKRVEQSEQRLTGSEEALKVARQTLRAAREAAVPITAERTRQAEDRVRQAEQALEASQQQLVISEIQQKRVAALFQKDLRSRRDMELADNELVKARTDVQRARLAVEVSKRDTNTNMLDQTRADIDTSRLQAEVDRASAAVEVAREDVNLARLELDRANIEVVRSRTELERAEAAVDVARRDTTVGDLDYNRVINDTAAQLSSIEALIAQGRETIASVNSDLQKVDVELANLQRRTEQQQVRAPRSGRIVRLMKVGAGATVKAGDILAVLAPDTEDQAVELMLSDNDAPLVRVGSHVRLQFAGWPAVQFVGWPSVAVGTFAGTVAVIDAVDDGTSRYRIIVVPDREQIASGRDEPWPSLKMLRPGAEAIGWVMLNQVSLGFELWRQFNAFPPTVERDKADKKMDKGFLKSGDLIPDTSEKIEKSGDIKIKR